MAVVGAGVAYIDVQLNEGPMAKLFTENVPKHKRKQKKSKGEVH